jgi:hypothetical protein
VTSALAHFTDLARRARTATYEDPFVEAVRHFIGLLQSVPDSTPAEWSCDSLAIVREASEDVVEAIEEWLERHETPGTTARKLARQIYTIRGALEEIDRWERHVLGSVK